MLKPWALEPGGRDDGDTPISDACRFLEPRRAIQILAGLWNGSARLNDIREGVGNISSAILPTAPGDGSVWPGAAIEELLEV